MFASFYLIASTNVSSISYYGFTMVKYCFDFRNEFNGIFALGWFFLRTIFDFLTKIFQQIFLYYAKGIAVFDHLPVVSYLCFNVCQNSQFATINDRYYSRYYRVSGDLTLRRNHFKLIETGYLS